MKTQIREGGFKEIAARVLPSTAIYLSGLSCQCGGHHCTASVVLHRSLPDLATAGINSQPAASFSRN